MPNIYRNNASYIQRPPLSPCAPSSSSAPLSMQQQHRRGMIDAGRSPTFNSAELYDEGDAYNQSKVSSNMVSSVAFPSSPIAAAASPCSSSPDLHQHHQYAQDCHVAAYQQTRQQHQQRRYHYTSSRYSTPSTSASVSASVSASTGTSSSQRRTPASSRTSLSIEGNADADAEECDLEAEPRELSGLYNMRWEKPTRDQQVGPNGHWRSKSLASSIAVTSIFANGDERVPARQAQQPTFTSHPQQQNAGGHGGLEHGLQSPFNGTTTIPRSSTRYNSISGIERTGEGKFDTLPPSSHFNRAAGRPGHQRHHSASNTSRTDTSALAGRIHQRTRQLSDSLRGYAASWIPASARNSPLMGLWNAAALPDSQPAAGSEPALDGAQGNCTARAFGTADFLPDRGCHHQQIEMDRSHSLDSSMTARRPVSPSSSDLAYSTKTQVSHGPPPKLDRRRLDKAVSLAVEAAQAAEEDEMRRREKDAAKRRAKRLNSTRAMAKRAGGTHAELETRARAEDALALGLYMDENYELDVGLDGDSPLALVPRNKQQRQRFGSDETRALVERERALVPAGAPPAGAVGGTRARLGRFLSLPRGASFRRPFGSHEYGSTGQSPTRSEEQEDDDDDDDDDLDEEARLDCDFSLDLYISSLTYLLSALSEKEALGVSDKHRREMTARLTEALDKFGAVRAQEEDVRQLRQQLATLQQQQHNLSQAGTGTSTPIIHHHYHSIAPDGFMKTWQEAKAASPTSLRPSDLAASAARSRKSSIVGTLASAALDAGLAVTAGAVAVAARGVASFVPAPLKSASAPASPKLDDPSEPPHQQQRSEQQDLSPQEKATKAQWDLALSLAGSAAQALSATLSMSSGKGSARRGSNTPPGSGAESSSDSDVQKAVVRRSPDGQSIEVGVMSKHAGKDSGDEIEEKVILVASSIARAIKRSPLPSQLSALLHHVVQLLYALDERYQVRQRATGLALKQAGMAARFIRQHHLHVILIRAALASFEAAIAAIEAYREEDAWPKAVAAQEQKRIAAGAASP